MSDAPTHNRPFRGRFHAWFLSATENLIDEIHGERKQKLLADLPDSVVEMGPGTGANFRYYRPGTHVVGIEPNERMWEKLRAKAAEHEIELDLRGLKGEQVDLEDACTDAVVCTLVLCSVDDPAQVVAEARRLLRPGGRFVFIEHVAAPAGTGLRRLQNVVQPPWTYCFEGCRPNRDTEAVLRSAGFATLELDAFRIPGPFVHCSPNIAGTATR